MAVSEVAIANSALIKVGSDRISSLTENTKGAIVCNEQYSKIRDALLSSHPWNFAIAQVQLGQDVVTPEFGWDHRYVLPSDVLRILTIGQGTKELLDDDWQKKGNYVYSDLDSLEIEYIQAITDVTLFPGYFSEALSWQLAADICWIMTQNASLVDQVGNMAEKKVREARSFDAQEGFAKYFQSHDWADEHRG